MRMMRLFAPVLSALLSLALAASAPGQVAFIPSSPILGGGRVYTVAATPNDSVGDDGAFQSALDAADAAGGGLVYIPSGRYLITGALTASAGTANATNRIALAVGSNTHILASDSATIQLKAFANCYLIGNKDWTNGNRNITVEGGVWDGNGGINVVDGVVQSGNLLRITFTQPYWPSDLTTATLAGEQFALKARANPAGADTVTTERAYNITAVSVSGSSVTLDVATSGGLNLTAAGGGTDLRGIISRQTRDAAGSPRYNGEISVWSGCKTLRFLHTTWVNGNKYCVALSGCSDTYGLGTRFNTGSDGVHMLGGGPATLGTTSKGHVWIGTTGTTGDNMFAVATDDTGYYTWPFEGNVSDVLILGTRVESCLEPVRLLAGKSGTPYTLEGVTVQDIRGTVTNYSYGIRVATDGSIATGIMRRIVLDGIDLIQTSNQYAQVVIDNNYVEDVTVRNLTQRSGNVQAIDVTSTTASLKKLSISGLSTADNTAQGQAFVRINGTVTDLSMTQVNAALGNAGSMLNIGTTGVVTRGVLTNCISRGVSGTNRGLYLQNTTTASVLTLSGVHLNNHFVGIAIDGDATINTAGVYLESNTTHINVLNAASNVNIFGSGIYSSSSPAVTLTAGATRVNNADASVDLTSSALNSTVGDLALNASASIAVPQGPAYCVAAGTPGTWVSARGSGETLVGRTSVTLNNGTSATQVFQPAAGSFLVTGVTLTITAVSSPSGTAAASLGITGAGYTDVVANTTLTGFNTSGQVWYFPITTGGILSAVTNGAPLFIKQNTGFASGTITVRVDVYGVPR